MPLDINSILKTDNNYNKVFNTYYNKVKQNFDLRNSKLELTYDDNNIKMKLSEFLVNLVLWKPFLYFGYKFEDEFLFDTAKVNADTLSVYFDKVIGRFLTEENHIELNECLSSIKEELEWFSLDFNPIIGNSINLRDWIDLAKRNEKFNELIHTKFDSTMSTDEIENEMRSRTAELMDILGTEKNNFRDYVNAKEGVNKDQLTQFMVNVGPKPDLKGNVYPKIVNTNFLVDGLQSASDYFIDASGGRKAAIINFGQVKKAGYTMRKLSLLCMNTLLDYNKVDCGTHNTMKFLIDSEKTLKRLNGRYYHSEGTTTLINGKIDKHLVGETIDLRSPITCSDKKICRTCYGELSKINNDIHVGILGIEILTSQLTQMLLSAKHLLKTNSEVINWSKDFQEYFSLDSNAVILNPSLDNQNRYSIIIEENNIKESEEISEDISDEMDFNKSIKSFKIGFKENGKNKVIKIDSDKDLYLSPYLEALLKKDAIKDDEGAYTLPFKNLDESEPLFFIEVENNELAQHLKDILDLIDNKDHLDVANKEEMLQKFVDLLNESGIYLDSVHAENVVRELIRTIEDITARPDFSQPSPTYQMLRMSDAIMNSESIIISFAFEKIKKQLYEPETYRKTAPSFLDKLFN